MAGINALLALLPATAEETIRSIARLHGENHPAKVIQLLEELTRSFATGSIKKREAMAQPADPKSVLDAMRETHAEAEQIGGRRGWPLDAVSGASN